MSAMRCSIPFRAAVSLAAVLLAALSGVACSTDETRVLSRVTPGLREGVDAGDVSTGDVSTGDSSTADVSSGEGAASPGSGGVARADVASATRQALDALVQPLIDGEWLMGAAVAVVSREAVETHGYGRLSIDGPPVDGHTIFEMGSITKTFTSLLLADLVRDGSVQLEQPVASLLPPGVSVPQLNGRAITLLDLATHTSGLPRLPTNLLPENPTPADLVDPYANYDVDDLYAFLASYTLTAEPGARFEYSNAGAGLLAHALTLAAGTSYAEAIQARIAAPVGLVDTRPEPDPAAAARIAQGHDVQLEPAPAWHHTPANEGSGGLITTAEDLGRYVAAELNAAALSADMASAGVPILQSMASTQLPRRTTDTGEPVGLAWFFAGPDVLWHNGASAGQSAIAILDRARGVGVAVLSNTASDYIDTLGFAIHQLLTTGVAQPLPLPPSVKLDNLALERCVGSYSFGADTGPGIVVTRDGTRLYFEFDGTRYRLFPTSPTTFSWRSANASLRFEPAGAEYYERVTIELDGQTYVATRL